MSFLLGKLKFFFGGSLYLILRLLPKTGFLLINTTVTRGEAPRLWRRNVLACGVGIWLIRCMDETSQELHTEGHGCAQCMQLERVAFYLKMCFKKCSEHAVFCTFWLENVLLATAACNFSTSELQKVVRDLHFFTILTWKCSSRHSGVQFFYISTSKSGPNM